MEAGDWGFCLALLLLASVLLHHTLYIAKKKHLPGPSFVIPFLGTAMEMVREPTKYWEKQADFSMKTGISCNYFFGKFVVFLRDSQLSQKVFTNVKPGVFYAIGHPFGKSLFGENNIFLMVGDVHKDLRRKLAPLFTYKALTTYVSIQEKTISSHVERWLAMASASKEPLALRNLCRDMNLEISQNVFVGPYLTPELNEQFTRDYHTFNVGLLALPLDFPGCAYSKAKHAVERLVSILTICARKSKAMMAAGEEPRCLLDYWTAEIIKDVKQAEEAGLPPPQHTADAEVGHHIFDFLFAAQDASTSSLVWAVTLLDSHPEVLAKVRAEQSMFSAPYTPEQLRAMKYTEMVVKEVVRMRPPATLVPHIAYCDFPIADTYTIPKGTLVFPSVLESSFQGFRDAHRFDPERFSAERQEDVVCKRNFLVFGAGPHQCIGQRYALNQLMLFTAILTSAADWVRIPSPDRDELVYTPTITPKDHGLVHLYQRKKSA